MKPNLKTIIVELKEKCEQSKILPSYYTLKSCIKKLEGFEAELIARIEKDEQIIKDSSQIDLSREGEDKRDHPLVAEFWNGHKIALEEILKE